MKCLICGNFQIMMKQRYKINVNKMWKGSIILTEVLTNFEKNYKYSRNPLKNRILCFELKTLKITEDLTAEKLQF